MATPPPFSAFAVLGLLCKVSIVAIPENKFLLKRVQFTILMPDLDSGQKRKTTITKHRNLPEKNQSTISRFVWTRELCLFDTSSVGLIRHFSGRRFRLENFVGLMLLDDSIRSFLFLFLELLAGQNVLIFEVLFVIEIHINYQTMGNYVPL